MYDTFDGRLIHGDSPATLPQQNSESQQFAKPIDSARNSLPTLTFRHVEELVDVQYFTWHV